MEKLVEIKELKKYYPIGRKRIDGKTEDVTLKAIDNLSFQIYKGENLGIVGESGCGKSTLGRCLLKLIEHTQGQIIFDQEDISTYSMSRMRGLRREMQMVFQNPYSSFNPKKTIGRSLKDVAGFYGLKGNAAKERIYQLLDYVNLEKTVMGRLSNELSGGQLQRLAIVRALIPNPKFLVADEPVSALDVSVQAQILNLLYDMKEEFGLTMMFISHELTVVEHICDRVMVMYLGSMVEIGTTEELFGNSMHPYTKALIASKPKDHPDEEKEKVPLTGEIPSPMDIPSGCRFSTRCPHCMPGICTAEEPPLYPVADGHWVACHLAKSVSEKFQSGV